MERPIDRYDLKAARVHGLSVEDARTDNRPVAAFDPSFGAVFVLVFKVWVSLIILSAPVAVVLMLLIR